jgi:ribosomal protein S18 acetylase RimI-like enzyme
VYVHFLAVDPAARGQGVGKVLLREAFKSADEGGVRTTLLNPKEINVGQPL